MNKVIVSLSALTATVVVAAASFLLGMPETTPTAVLGEKPTKVLGNQVVTKLPEDLSVPQSRALQIAYEIAKADGHRSPEIVQSVLLQETNAGGMAKYRVANPGPEAYFGLMQVKLATAKGVLARYPAMFTKHGLQGRTDDEIKANLILNDRFNLEVGSKYILMLQRDFGYVGRELLNAYNRGPAGVKSVDDTYHYALGAEAKLAAAKGRKK